MGGPSRHPPNLPASLQRPSRPIAGQTLHQPCGRHCANEPEGCKNKVQEPKASVIVVPAASNPLLLDTRQMWDTYQILAAGESAEARTLPRGDAE